MKNKKHTLAYSFGRWLVTPLVKRILNYSGDIVDVGNRPSIIMCNHTTNWDIPLVGISFPQQMYMVATEHVFRWGIISSFLKFFFAPIPRFKGKIEVTTARQVLSYLREGEHVCIFPEGSMSIDGLTMDIIPSTGKLVKLSKADLVTYRIEGGYLSYPRWAENLRRGKTRGILAGRYTAEDLKDMSVEEINAIISRDIFVDAYKVQETNPIPYRGKNLAEFIEKALYICPKCKQIATIKSKGNIFSCSCGLKCTYTELGYIEGEGLDFTTVTQWMKWQYQFMKDRIAEFEENEIICSDEEQTLSALEPCVKTTLITSGKMALSRKELRIGNCVFPIEDIINFYRSSKLKLIFSTVNGENYEINSKIMRSAFKYQSIISILKDKPESSPF